MVCNASLAKLITLGVLRIGGLFPVFKTAAKNFVADNGGIHRLEAAIFAIDEINNRSDILPNTKIEFYFQDSKRDEGASFFGALTHTTEYQVHAVLGASSSGCSANAALVTRQFKTPHVSYASSSPQLSDAVSYPYFMRTAPSDAFQSTGIAELIRAHGWEKVGLARGTDGYSSGGSTAFLNEAKSKGLVVISSVTFLKDTNNYKKHVETLRAASVKVLVLIAQTSDGINFLQEATKSGFIGPNSGVTVIGTDTIAADYHNDPLVKQVLPRGFLGMVPTNGYGSAKYEKFANAFIAQKPTSKRADGSCHPGKDRAGNWLYQQDHDKNPSTPNECSGIDYPAQNLGTVNAYASYSYDTVYAVAYAAHNLLEKHKITSPDDPKFKGEDFKNELLQNIDFEGVTGRIKFAAGDPDADNYGQGDRQIGAKYIIWNWDGNELNKIGSWDAGTGVVACKADKVDKHCSPERYATACADDACEKNTNPAVHNAKPVDFVIPAHDKNLIPASFKSVAYTMFALTFASILVCSVWLYLNRKSEQVRCSQPFFLVLVLLGCAISSSTIIALGQDNSFACKLFPWLYSIGFAVTFGSLFAKIKRVHKIFKKAKKLKRVKVTVKETLAIIVFLVLCDIIILGVWTGKDPLTWERNVQQEDRFGNVLSSAASCRSDTATIYIAVIGAFHFVLLIHASILCYVSRNLPTKFAEGKYVALAIVSNLEVFILGIPVLIIVGDNPSTSFFVRSAIIWLNDLAVILLIFGNLMYANGTFKFLSPPVDKTLATQNTVATQNNAATANRPAATTKPLAPLNVSGGNSVLPMEEK